ncbi:MAG: flippase-like domain-containing protein [Clostridiaceae bacterium]|jgi:glycosyltransferase 2 family protein|nr:flippase-like domain-containing protein [Clostridiaceae bacterium]
MKKKSIFILLITVFILGLIFYKINFAQLILTFKHFNFNHIPLIVFLYILTLFIRGIRWKALLVNDNKYSPIHLAEVFTVGSMLNSFLPARAGDLYRAYYLGSIKGENKVKVLGSVILERLMDGVAVFFILLATVLLFCKKTWIIKFTYFTGAIFVGTLVVFYLVFKFNKIDSIAQNIISLLKNIPEKISSNLSVFITKSAQFLNSFLDGFEALNDLKCVVIAITSSFAIWLLEAYISYLIVNSFNFGLGISAGLFVMCLTSFSTVIPSASVFLGPYQYAYIIALGLFDVSKSSALAVSTVQQAIFMLILTVLGCYYFVKFNISLKDIQDNQ